ncbi:MAG TPA: lipopolysaccharide biosynthesis protein [Pyrinomonadaceae bacterium]|jgi:O-antigen/teichoic acid export membrane protein
MSTPSSGKFDVERHLLADQPPAEMRSRAARGAAVILLFQGCKFGLLFGVNIILARLLVPEDFGLVAVVTSVVAGFSLFNDLSLPMATVQRHEINHEQVSLLFWINTLWGCALAAAAAATAPLFAGFYGEPRLTPIILVLSTGFVFFGVGSQHRALLKRRMRFTALAVTEFVALVPGVVIGLVLAWLGFRYWALVYMRLATGVFTTLGVLLTCGWRPGRPRWSAPVRPLLTFGSHLTGLSVLAYLTRYADNLLIGWFSGPRALGLYYKAYQMLLVPSQQFSTPLSGLVIPTLSRLQLDPQRFVAYYRRSLLLSAAAGMPPIAFLFVTAGWVVPLLLGGQWAESVPLFRALALAAFIGPVEFGSSWVVIPLGRPDRQFKWTLFATLFTLAGFVVGTRWGAFGVALSFSVCRAVLLVPKLMYACKGTPVRWTEVFRTASHPALASLAAAAGLFALARQFPFSTRGVSGLVSSGLCFGLMYIGVWAMLPGGRRTLRSLFGLLHYLR